MLDGNEDVRVCPEVLLLQPKQWFDGTGIERDEPSMLFARTGDSGLINLNLIVDEEVFLSRARYRQPLNFLPASPAAEIYLPRAWSHW